MFGDIEAAIGFVSIPFAFIVTAVLIFLSEGPVTNGRLIAVVAMIAPVVALLTGPAALLLYSIFGGGTEKIYNFYPTFAVLSFLVAAVLWVPGALFTGLVIRFVAFEVRAR
jgi:hypothetical protein